MNSNVQEIEKYPIPFKRHSSYKWRFHLLFLIIIVMFSGFMFIPMGNDAGGIIFKLLEGAMSLFFIYLWLFIGVLKKGYIELTEDHIKLTHSFGTKTLKWREIYDIQVYTQSSNTILGLISKKKMKKRKASFKTALGGMFGGMFSMGIPMSQFSDVDLQKLYATVFEMVKVASENSVSTEEPLFESSEAEGRNNLFLALGISLLISVAVGFGYGFTRLLKTNIIFIPILGTFAVLYAYHKNYREDGANIPARLALGLISTLQVFIATITSVFLLAKIPVNMTNIVDVTKEYFQAIADDPFRWMVDIMMALICFGYASVQGYTFKAQRRLSKLFMKKGGRHYYKREGRTLNIYMIDPVEYNEQKEGNRAAYINEGCFIELQKKKVTGFYIPAKYLEELGSRLNRDNMTVIGEEQYCVIDLGATGDYKPYVYTCYIYANSKNEVELIKVEI